MLVINRQTQSSQTRLPKSLTFMHSQLLSFHSYYVQQLFLLLHTTFFLTASPSHFRHICPLVSLLNNRNYRDRKFEIGVRAPTHLERTDRYATRSSALSCHLYISPFNCFMNCEGKPDLHYVI